jgi:hypothetical protein
MTTNPSDTARATVITVDLPDGGQCNIWVWTDDPAAHIVEASYRPDRDGGTPWGPPLNVLVEHQG